MNLLSSVAMCHHAVPGMRERGWGRVLAVGLMVMLVSDLVLRTLRGRKLVDQFASGQRYVLITDDDNPFEEVLHIEPFPSVADVACLAQYPALAVGLLLMATASSECTSMKFCAPVIVSIVSTRFWTPASLSAPPALLAWR